MVQGLQRGPSSILDPKSPILAFLLRLCATGVFALKWRGNNSSHSRRLHLLAKSVSSGIFVLMISFVYQIRAPMLAAMLFWLASSISSPAVAEPAALTSGQIMQKAIQRAESRQDLSNNVGSKYLYTKRTVTEELNPSGRLKDRKERLYEVLVDAGISYLKLLQINGQNPPAAELRKTEAREAAERQKLTDAKPGAKGDGRENFLTAELVDKYKFILLGDKTLNGRLCHVLRFEPRGNLPVRKLTDRFLNQISGALWVDAEEFEIARFEVHLNSEITLWGGLVATLKQCDFSLERTRLPDGVWLDSFSHGLFEGRKLLEPVLIRTRSESSNFRPVALALH